MASHRRMTRKNRSMKRKGGNPVFTNVAIPVALVAANTLIKGKKGKKGKKSMKKRFTRSNKRR